MSARQACFFDDLPEPAPAARAAVPAPTGSVVAPDAPQAVHAPAEPPPATLVDPLTFLPLRPIPWTKLLARRSAPVEPIISVQACYTSMTIETMIDPEAGRWSLLSSGEIIESCMYGPPVRIIYFDQVGALRLHALAPLTPKREGSYGSFGGSFRFLRSGETPTVKTGAIISAFRRGGVP